MRVLILDDDECRHDVFRKYLEGHNIVHVYTASQAIEKLNAEKFDMVCLDHDLDLLSDSLVGNDTGTGLEVAEYIAVHMEREKLPGAVLIHSWNPPGAREMEKTLKDGGVRVFRRQFSTSMPWLRAACA